MLAIRDVRLSFELVSDYCFIVIVFVDFNCYF